jgi:hypothetical protein
MLLKNIPYAVEAKRAAYIVVPGCHTAKNVVASQWMVCKRRETAASVS